MIDLVERENFSSEEEYERALEQMLQDIEEHNRMNPEPKYDPNYKENFPNSLECD